MMMNKITVIIYSYKGKLLKDTVDNLIKSSYNANNIEVVVLDQHPLMRAELFKNMNVMYKHIFWDWIEGPCFYKNVTLSNINTQYTLILSDNIVLSDNWDQVFIDFVGSSKNIISGNNNITLEQNDLFYVKKRLSQIDNFTLTQYIDRSLIFAQTETLNSIQYPNYLKYNGEEESLSVQAFVKGSDIFACPTRMYMKVGEDSITQIYTPFSVNHNYNEVLDLLNYGNNSYLIFEKTPRLLSDFNNFHNNIFNKLKKLPFQTNDVSYSPQNLDFNGIDARKFIARTRAIH